MRLPLGFEPIMPRSQQISHGTPITVILIVVLAQAGWSPIEVGFTVLLALTVMRTDATQLRLEGS